MSLSTSEYHPYYGNYISLSADGPLVEQLETSLVKFQDFVSGIPENKMNYSYDAGKWTVAELLMHLIDAERVFQHRAFRFSRNDKTPLPGFEQDDYVVSSRANDRTMLDHRTEFTNVRNATIDLFNGFSEKEFLRFGSANGLRVDVNSIGYITIGHLYHHMEILKSRYLK